jgi:hypothetical protein
MRNISLAENVFVTLRSTDSSSRRLLPVLCVVNSKPDNYSLNPIAIAWGPLKNKLDLLRPIWPVRNLLIFFRNLQIQTRNLLMSKPSHRYLTYVEFYVSTLTRTQRLVRSVRRVLTSSLNTKYGPTAESHSQSSQE